jgi:HK97 family phage portal protein
MNFFTKESKQIREITSAVRLFSPNSEVNYPKDYEYFAGLYDTVLWVNAIIRKVATKAVAVPWDILKVENKDDKLVETPIDRLHRARALLTRPNERQTYKSFMQGVITYYLLNGDSYIELAKNPKDAPIKSQSVEGMYTIRPDRIKIKASQDGKKIESYIFQVKPRSKKVTFRPEDIIHMNSFSPNDDFYGQSAIAAAASTILKEQYTDQYQQNVVKFDAIPRGVLESDYDIEEDEAGRILDSWKNKFQGIDNKNSSIAILPYGLKFKALQMAPKDIEYLKLLHDNRQRMFSAFGVNNAVMGIMEGITRENFRMQIRSFYMDTVKTILDLVKEIFERFLFEQYFGDDGKNLILSYDYESQVKEDEAELSARLQKEILVGMRSPNEARQKFGEPTYEGGNTYFMMSNVVPIYSEDFDLRNLVNQGNQNQNNQNIPGLNGASSTDFNRDLKI